MSESRMPALFLGHGKENVIFLSSDGAGRVGVFEEGAKVFLCLFLGHYALDLQRGCTVFISASPRSMPWLCSSRRRWMEVVEVELLHIHFDLPLTTPEEDETAHTESRGLRTVRFKCEC